MRLGMDPTAAAEDALNRISRYYPAYSGALVTVNISGNYGKWGWVESLAVGRRNLGIKWYYMSRRERVSWWWWVIQKGCSVECIEEVRVGDVPNGPHAAQIPVAPTFLVSKWQSTCCSVHAWSFHVNFPVCTIQELPTTTIKVSHSSSILSTTLNWDNQQWLHCRHVLWYKMFLFKNVAMRVLKKFRDKVHIKNMLYGLNNLISPSHTYMHISACMWWCIVRCASSKVTQSNEYLSQRKSNSQHCQR